MGYRSSDNVSHSTQTGTDGASRCSTDQCPKPRARVELFCVEAAQSAACLGIAAAHADQPVQRTPAFFAPGTGLSHPDAEPTFAYDLVPPVTADVLGADPLSHQQSMDAWYFMSVFGPRFKLVSSSNVGYFDFHQGSDITPDVAKRRGDLSQRLAAAECLHVRG